MTDWAEKERIRLTEAEPGRQGSSAGEAKSRGPDAPARTQGSKTVRLQDACPSPSHGDQEPLSSGAAGSVPKPPGLYLIGFCLLLCLPLGPFLDVKRAQTLSAFSDLIAPNSPTYVDNKADLARSYLALGDLKAADAVLERLLGKLRAERKPGGHDLRVSYVQLLLAVDYQKEGRQREALAAWREAVEAIGEPSDIKKKDYPSGMTGALLKLARKYDEQYRAQGSQPSGEKASTSNRPSSGGKLMEERLLNHPDLAAIELYEKTLSLWDLQAAADTKSNVHADLAQLYEDTGESQKALDNFVAAYNIYKGSGATSFNAYRLLHIGMNLSALKRFDQAEPVLEKGVAMVKSAWRTPYNVVLGEYSLGRVKYELGKYSEARALFKSAIAGMYKESIGLNFCWAKYYLAKCCRELGDTVEARKLFEKVIELKGKDYDGPAIETVKRELEALPRTRSVSSTKGRE